MISLNRRLTNYYWHNLPKEAGFPFLAFVEHTNYVEPEHYGGDHIIYCGDYLDLAPIFPMGEEKLLERFLPSHETLQCGIRPQLVKEPGCGRRLMLSPCRPLTIRTNIPPLRRRFPASTSPA